MNIIQLKYFFSKLISAKWQKFPISALFFMICMRFVLFPVFPYF